MEEKNKNSSLDEAAYNYFKAGDEISLQQVMNTAANLIRFYAHLYGKGCDQEDIFQTGMVGLLKALKGYDPGKGASFVTYASHLIIGEIRHMVRKQASYYRPGCIVELQFKVDKIVQDYTQIYGDIPSYSYIAQQLKVRVESVDEVMKAGLISFDEIDTSKIHSSMYESFHLPIEDKLALNMAFKKLTQLQQRIIYMLFFQDMSQQRVAEKIGLNQKKVSRIKKQCLNIMYENIEYNNNGTNN